MRMMSETMTETRVVITTACSLFYKKKGSHCMKETNCNNLPSDLNKSNYATRPRHILNGGGGGELQILQRGDAPHIRSCTRRKHFHQW